MPGDVSFLFSEKYKEREKGGFLKTEFIVPIFQ